MPILIHVTEDNREYTLGERTVIGRGDGCDIRILDGLVSKQHAEIVASNGRWSLRDLNSSNGTIVNGRRVHAHDLGEGDRITFGSAQLVFTHASAQQPKAPGVALVEGSAPAVQAKIDRPAVEGFRPIAQITDLEQLKRDYEKLRIANELNRAIGLEPDVDKLLAKILDEIFKLLPADRGVILMMDPETRQLHARAVKHSGDSQEAINLSSTIINQVFATGQSLVTMDAMVDPRFSGAKSVMMGGIRSTMDVPMIYQSQLFGIIHLDSLIAVNAFSEKDLQILDGVAAQAAQAIDSAFKAKQLERNALARRNFERLLPPEVVEQVINGGVRLERSGELRGTTVMFTDIRGFTSWSEQHEPAHIVAVLNDYFELMVDAIHRHKGTLDKFMGDGIMALFGAPIAYGDDAINAVDCALEMARFLVQFNKEHEATGDQFAVGIGIDTGPVVAGYMGSSKSMEYTAIGDHVNLSARLCAAAAPGQILVTTETLGQLRNRFTAVQLPPIQVKGKAQPIPIFEITGYASQF